ncbi:MAG: DUF433 domain-containing protein [Acidobacteriota bacterium]|jgi:uncharacterized protein (DUF433 family)
MTFNYHDRIQRDPRVAGGQAVIKGTRVTLRTVLASLAEGATIDEILKDFPTLTDVDVRAAIAFAAASAQEDLPVAEALVR